MRDIWTGMVPLELCPKRKLDGDAESFEDYPVRLGSSGAFPLSDTFFCSVSSSFRLLGVRGMDWGASGRAVTLLGWTHCEILLLIQTINLSLALTCHCDVLLYIILKLFWAFQKYQYIFNPPRLW
jgi:hypothetical protein